MFAVLLLAGCGSTASAPASFHPPHLRTAGYPRSPVCPVHQKTQLDLEDCAARRGFALDARFNTVVGKLWPILGDAARRKFVHAHTEWLKYVKAECAAAELQFRGGSIAPLVQIDCENTLTRARVVEVAGMYASYTQGR